MPNQKTNLTTRSSPLSIDKSGVPKTLDDDNRSVGVVATTEAPAKVFDWERFEVVEEVLLMDGVKLPGNKQVPLLDGHSRDGVQSVIGSFRDMKVENGELTGRAFFASDADSSTAFTKVKEGHLTDFSVGYGVTKSHWVPEDETYEVKGKTYNGPLKISSEWQLKELSAVPIGADPDAKARADIKPQIQKEGEKMPDKEVKKEVQEEVKEETPIKVVDHDAIKAAAVLAERKRVIEITDACKRHGVESITQELIDSGADMTKANEEILKNLDKQESIKTTPDPITIVKDERDKFRSAAMDAILIRSGSAIEKPAEGAHDLTGYTMVELARHCLRNAGMNQKGRPLEMVGRALNTRAAQTSDFPALLANVANKALFTGWSGAEETWQDWCGTGSVSDFKTNYLPRVSEGGTLDEIPEGGEYKYGKRSEAQESYSIATYGKMFAITRQALIDDDLSALNDTPAMHGEMVSRKLGDMAYAVLSANAAMGDGVALCHATHSNLVASGSGAAPGIATIAAGILAMGMQKDLAGNRSLNIRPVFFLGPRALEGAAEVFFRTEKWADSDTVATDSSLSATRMNPYNGTYFKRIYDARMDDDVATKWFLMANKNRTVNMYFLNGVQKPFLEAKEGWSVDGIEYKVRIDAGAKAVDWRGVYQNYGA